MICGCSQPAANEQEVLISLDEVAAQDDGATGARKMTGVYIAVPETEAGEALSSGLSLTGAAFDVAFDLGDPRIRNARRKGFVVLEVKGVDVDVIGRELLAEYVLAESLSVAREHCKYGERCNNFDAVHREQFLHPDEGKPQVLREASSRDEPATELLSAVQARGARGPGTLPFARIVPKGKVARWDDAENTGALPTVLAISGEEQLHVSAFFRSWRAEAAGWQVAVPLRPKMGTPYLFDPAGVELVVGFMRELLADRDLKLLPSGVESGGLHLVGCSNGAAAALAAAVAAPELVLSLSLVAGFIPDELKDVSPLRGVQGIQMYVGSKDTTHLQSLTELKSWLDASGIPSELTVVEGASHGNISRMRKQHRQNFPVRADR
ncbi:unnamed protein product [Prorocentrum cordatum]|uniref:Phospholipase/carboxylesterase/thioesterase domain-containing protein n=1 Tax=Prorocentrum cordatum TaxID=2364126 RepID=A0ABN9X7D5_9DINO|nr:unnamed protein product [Polarella glacialis]